MSHCIHPLTLDVATRSLSWSALATVEWSTVVQVSCRLGSTRSDPLDRSLGSLWQPAASCCTHHLAAHTILLHTPSCCTHWRSATRRVFCGVRFWVWGLGSRTQGPGIRTQGLGLDSGWSDAQATELVNRCPLPTRILSVIRWILSVFSPLTDLRKGPSLT